MIIPSLNDFNCILFLEETHKKLKNQENGSPCWYTLLNASINYLSNNLYSIYKIEAEKIQKLHEKIINEVLDRAIRMEKKNDN